MATREVVRYLAGADLAEIMTTRRGIAAVELHDLIQSEADRLKLGVHILFIGLQGIHPPTTVASDFEAVVGAQLEIEAKVFQAQGEASATNLSAQAQSLTQVREAEGTTIRRKGDAAANAAQFTNQLVAYTASPKVYMTRTYLKALAQGGAGATKYVIAPTNTSDVIQLNLEESIGTRLLREVSGVTK